MPRYARALALLALVLSPARGTSQSSLVTVERGTIPVLMTVPHGGTHAVPGVARRSSGVTDRDGDTIELAERAAARLEAVLGERPYLVIAEFHRSYIDANRPADEAFEDADAAVHYRAYHDAIRGFIEELRSASPAGAVLLDVHGHAKEGFRDKVCRGTRNGRTVTRLRQWFGDEAVVGPDSILGSLAAAGWTVFPRTLAPEREDPCFNGGFTVVQYGSHHRDGIDAIQLEVGSLLRRDEFRDDFADALGDALARFLEVHVVCTPDAPYVGGSAERSISASDALFVLRVAIGAAACPPCVCDVDDSGAITAADALRVLRKAVGSEFAQVRTRASAVGTRRAGSSFSTRGR